MEVRRSVWRGQLLLKHETVDHTELPDSINEVLFQHGVRSVTITEQAGNRREYVR